MTHTATESLSPLAKRLSLFLDIPILTTGITAFFFDFTNDNYPHLWDQVSPAIENHIGNAPYSFFLTILINHVLQHLIIPQLPLEAKARDSLRQAAPFMSTGIMLAANIVNELMTPNNSEFGGDVTVGFTFAALGLIRTLLPYKTEDYLAARLNPKLSSLKL